MAVRMKPLSDCRLYTFVDTGYLHGRQPAEIARQLCDGGADLVQLRAKGRPAAEIQRLAESILPVTERAGVWLVINDHLEVARAVGAPICHLGQEDFFDAGFTRVSQLAGSTESRPTLGGQESSHEVQRAAGAVAHSSLVTGHSSPLIGLSTHAPAQAERAVAAGAAYVAIGPVFATPTKPGRPAVTLDYVRWAAAHLAIPWFAIGGIHLGNLDAVLAAGARRICVVSAILNAPDIAGACRQFRERLAFAAS